jgi:hypothetical protein
MKKRLLLVLVTVLFLCGTVSLSLATPVTFFGEDVTSGSYTGTRTNSDAAHDDFMANLTGVGTENFEAYFLGTSAPLTLNFTGAGTATLTGTGSVADSTSAGRWATSGRKYWAARTGDFAINFSNPISAFGFYGTDIGDFGGSLKIEYTNGSTSTLDVGNTVSQNGGTSGSVLYFGFYENDPSKAFSSISFLNNSTGDYFGFDDMTIGTYEQVTPTVPEPSTLLLMGLGFLGLLGYGRKRCSKH